MRPAQLCLTTHSGATPHLSHFLLSSSPPFPRPPVPYALAQPATNPASLAAAVDEVVRVLGGAVKPVLLAGGWVMEGGGGAA